MSNLSGRGFIKNGVECIIPSIDNLDDRIINIRFERRHGVGAKRFFTIRSDWELRYDGGNGYSIVPCVEKPDIKVVYKQVSQGCAIDVEIYVTNFNIEGGDVEAIKRNNTSAAKEVRINQRAIDDADADAPYLIPNDDVEGVDGIDTQGTSEVDISGGAFNSHGGNPIISCTIQMGYRGQFPKPETVAEFHNLTKSDRAVTHKGKRMQAPSRLHNEIHVQILGCYPQSYPPDRVVFFKGIVGTVSDALRWTPELSELLSATKEARSWRATNIEQMLYDLITRRFINSVHTHKVETGTVKRLDANGYPYYVEEQQVFVLDIDKDGGISWVKLKHSNGRLSRSDANEYGVKCYVSRRLRWADQTSEKIAHYGIPKEMAYKLPIETTSTNTDMRTKLDAQLATIKCIYPFLCWDVNNDGDLLFYHEDEKVDDLAMDESIIKDPYIFLPAVYEVSPSGLRTIKCPFVTFINPQQKVIFQSTYSTGTFVSYFYTPRTNCFSVILATIRFATVQDDNEMELQCTDMDSIEPDILEGILRRTTAFTDEDIEKEKQPNRPKGRRGKTLGKQPTFFRTQGAAEEVAPIFKVPGQE